MLETFLTLLNRVLLSFSAVKMALLILFRTRYSSVLRNVLLVMIKMEIIIMILLSFLLKVRAV